jgi:hypothetical protein
MNPPGNIQLSHPQLTSPCAGIPSSCSSLLFPFQSFEEVPQSLLVRWSCAKRAMQEVGTALVVK